MKAYPVSLRLEARLTGALYLLNMMTGIAALVLSGKLAAGETLMRSEAMTTLQGLLSILPERRPIPHQQILFITETGWNALVVYWVYRESDHRLVGLLARDTWVQTAEGWKRIRHEKLFPTVLLWRTEGPFCWKRAENNRIQASGERLASAVSNWRICASTDSQMPASNKN